MAKKRLNMDKATPVAGVQGATVPNAVAEIGNISIDGDTVTVGMHFFLTEHDADNGINPIGSFTFSYKDPSLERKILTEAKKHALFGRAIDI